MDNSAGSADPRFLTADAVRVTEGLRVWDNDLKPGTVWVEGGDTDLDRWDGWFRVLCDDGETALVNGERMTTRHPVSRAPVPDPPADPRREDLVALGDAGVLLVTTANQTADARPVVFDPRVKTDPKPWLDPFARRLTTAEVRASPLTTDQVETYVRTLVPAVRDLTLFPAMTGNVSIRMIRVHYHQRGQRHGQRALGLITDWADERGVTLTATPEPAHLDGERRTGKQRLHRLYTRHGFVNNRGRRPQYNDSMFREPRTPAPTER